VCVSYLVHSPVIPPPDANIIPRRYVFRRKHNETGNIVRYKARLVVKGFKQQFGVDYMDTFAPTIRAFTLRILLSFAAQKGAAIHRCDVKNVYLNSRLKDNVSLYSDLPPKYEFFFANYHQNSKTNLGLLESGSSRSMAQNKVLMIGTRR
jgi:hypothetical protein